MDESMSMYLIQRIWVNSYIWYLILNFKAGPCNIWFKNDHVLAHKNLSLRDIILTKQQIITFYLWKEKIITFKRVVWRRRKLILIELNLRELILIKSELDVNWFMFGSTPLKMILMSCCFGIVWTKIDFESTMTKLSF